MCHIAVILHRRCYQNPRSTSTSTSTTTPPIAKACAPTVLVGSLGVGNLSNAPPREPTGIGMPQWMKSVGMPRQAETTETPREAKTLEMPRQATAVERSRIADVDGEAALQVILHSVLTGSSWA
ncbi:unnamed protein product [Cyclocybe aegerita]|uniref:Uncharacterized protein n=1 Tax=Cyclocybe aegerita TaxID=1973307 RepID=A0A8S0VUN3_CYCAE|nr:unnamed protein product [Cyclocybe aegerita]